MSLLGWLLLAVLGVWLLWWSRRAFGLLKIRRPEADQAASAAVPAAAAKRPASLQHHLAAAAPDTSPKDVEFRAQGERGMGGPVYGDLLCADGIYLPHVWEDHFHTSFDGRWMRTSAHAGQVARLVDRKTRRCWLLNHEEATAVTAVYGRLPRWNLAQGAAAEEGQNTWSDEECDTWLAEHVSRSAQELVAALDLWIPPDCMPDASQMVPPTLPKPPRDAAVKLSLQRHLPASLRVLRNPMQVLEQPVWQLYFDDAPQPWGVPTHPCLQWRGDGQALALLGVLLSEGEDRQEQMAVWSKAYGWQHWSGHMPEDRKPWTLTVDIPPPQDPDAPAAPSALEWDGEVLVQRMLIDTPELERLHDGRSLSCTVSDTENAAAHTRDGRVLVRPQPRTSLAWLRDLQHPERWRARSQPVAGAVLEWTLTEAAADVHGATAGYQLQWGGQKFPNTWELEHVVVRGRWAVLLPSGAVPRHGGVRYVQIWDGEQLQRVDLPGAVVRLRPAPSGARQGARVQALVLVGCVADKQVEAGVGTWRWPVQEPSPGPLGQIDNSAVYEWRDIAQDVHGFWRLQPRWREAHQVQHPCADGDYVWRFAPGGDELWWWGGIHQGADNSWSPEQPRIQGVSVTSGGAVLCGTGPCALPQPEGKGWAVLELAAQSNDEAHHWLLHWLRPDAREVRTLELRAGLPLLLGWDASGLHWRDGTPAKTQTAEGEAAKAARQTVAGSAWDQAKVERLTEGARGLWLRKQDHRYTQVLLQRDDWPWDQGR